MELPTTQPRRYRDEAFQGLGPIVTPMIQTAPPNVVEAAEQDMRDGLYPPMMLRGALVMVYAQHQRCAGIVAAYKRAAQLLRL